jgi:hypothetical protein
VADAQTLIGRIVLGADTATAVFANIPQNYAHLQLVLAIPSGYAGSGSGVKFNSDTDYTNNYSRVVTGGNGSSAYSFINSGSGNPTANHDLGALRANGDLTADFICYSSIDKHKTVLVRANGAANETAMQATRWASTSAINAITLSTDGAGNLPSGSTFTLYGIAG